MLVTPDSGTSYSTMPKWAFDIFKSQMGMAQNQHTYPCSDDNQSSLPSISVFLRNSDG